MSSKFVKIDFDTSKIIKDYDKLTEKGVETLSQQVLKDSNFYVRKDSGLLETSSIKASNTKKGEVVWNTPYAKRVYYTGNPSKDVNSNASLMWFEKAKSKYWKDWINIVSKIIMKG